MSEAGKKAPDSSAARQLFVRYNARHLLIQVFGAIYFRSVYNNVLTNNCATRSIMLVRLVKTFRFSSSNVYLTLPNRLRKTL